MSLFKDSHGLLAIKTVFIILFFSTCLLVSQFARAQEFVEGTHYSVIDGKAATQTAEIVEYFSFSCPGCYAMEPHIQKLLNAQPSAELRRVHMSFGGGKAKLSQKAFVLMKILDADRHKDAIFARIHKNKNLFDNDDELMAFFENLGYERALLEQHLRSFTADTMIRTMNKEGKENLITSVPTIVINGRYKVNLRAVYSGADLAELVKHLARRGS